MPADRATSDTDTPGSSDAATRRSFSSRDQRRRLSTDVITSTRGIVIGLLLGLSLGLPMFALSLQGGSHRRDTLLHHQRKTRKALPHVGVACRQPHPHAVRTRDHRDSSASSTRRSASASTSRSTRTRRPPPSSIS